MSPLSIAFIVLLAGAAGAALLTEFYDAGEGGGFRPEKLQVGGEMKGGIEAMGGRSRVFLMTNLRDTGAGSFRPQVGGGAEGRGAEGGGERGSSGS